MLILGLDSTAVTASAAIANVQDGVLTTYSLFTVKNKMTHSENLMPMVEQVLHLYGATLDELELLAVNVGPGSFTGVRIGVATVKGLAFPRALPCAPVSTLESLAEALAGTDGDGVVCPLMDARRGQFYAAAFENGARLLPDSCMGTEQLCEYLSALHRPITLCGDGAAVFRSLCGADAPYRLANPLCRDQNALAVALCGYRMHQVGLSVSGKELRPLYLRLPQAERERLAREGN